MSTESGEDGSDQDSEASVRTTMESLMHRIAALESVVALLASQMGIPATTVAVPPRQTAGRASSEIQRNHLDRMCRELLEATAEPDNASMGAVSEAIQAMEQYRHVAHRTILSQVRRWFRKRREEMGMRVISVFRRRYAHDLLSDAGVGALLAALEAENPLVCLDLGPVLAEARIEVRAPDEADRFARGKIGGFLRRLPAGRLADAPPYDDVYQ